MGQIADADGNAVPVTIWGADGYDAPERTRKLYSDDNTRMRMYDFPHYPRVELRETVNMGGPFTIVRYLDAFRFLFYLGDVNRGLCSCSGRFFLDYASGDPAEGVAAPDGMRLSFEKDEALSVNCDVVGTLAPIPDLLRSSVYPDESR